MQIKKLELKGSAKQNTVNGEAVVKKEKSRREKGAGIPFRTRRRISGFLYTVPWIIGFCMFFAVPIVNTIWWSFHEVSVKDEGGMGLDWSGFYNYVSLFTEQVASQSRTFAQVFTDENVNVLVNTPIIVIFSLFLALLANVKFKGQGIVRTVFFLPIVLGLEVVTEMIAISNGGDLSARNSGLFSEGFAAMLLLRYTTISKDVVLTITGYADNIFALISKAGVQTLIYLAGLQSISPSLYEVAKIEGATTYESFWKVTLPSIGNISLFVVIYTIVDLFLKSSIASEVYRFAFSKSRIGIASALSVLYMLNVLLLLAIVLLVSKKVVKKDA